MSLDCIASMRTYNRSKIQPATSASTEQVQSSSSEPYSTPSLSSPHIDTPEMINETPSLPATPKSMIHRLPCTPLPERPVHLEIQTYTDLLSMIQGVSIADKDNIFRLEQLYPTLHDQSSDEKDVQLSGSTELKMPKSVQLNIESSQMLESLMYRAATHWCCIGFKVAPIDQELIQNWRQAPPTIVYCVASISLVTFMDHQAGQSFVKEAAMMFYEQARQKMDDILFDDMEPLIIQSYFCLSYTSNLLRLYEQQRTWGGLASIALQQRVHESVAMEQPIDNSTIMCWCRWYYVDAWMGLTLNRDCLLSDEVLSAIDHDLQLPETLDVTSPSFCQYNLSQFAALAHYMRRYMRALQSGAIFSSTTSDEGLIPSALYYTITGQVKDWYVRQIRIRPFATSHGSPHDTFGPSFCPGMDVHLHLCYNAMRLVILFHFLHPSRPPRADILIDCLETNLALLQALQHLKDIGCDQSTYHHMFFAIHSTAKRIFQYHDREATRGYAKEQLCMNLLLLRGTQAYANDVFKMRRYAKTIESQFRHLGISVENPLSPSSDGARQHKPNASSSALPGTFVFRLQQPAGTSTFPRKRAR